MSLDYYLSFDSFDEICDWIESDRACTEALDVLISLCQHALREQALDELTAEAQELGLGY